MWVYQEQASPAMPAEKAEASVKAEERSLSRIEETAAAPQQRAQPLMRGAQAAQNEPLAKRNAARTPASRATKDCILLAAAYLMGTAAAGALQALCDARELEVLAYYLERWRALFAVTGAESAAALFGAEYLAVAGAVTALLLLGLSALGPVLIFLFVMLYGTGSGLLTAQIFAGLGWKQAAAYFFFAGVPAAAAAGCLCLFGASALQVSSRLQSFSFSGRSRNPTSSGARVLLGQYLLTAVVLVPVCGAATGLAVLAARLPLG
ncbi:MAG: hypothetical protein ACI4JC_06065 [Faecalibacterium sp.]